MGGDCADLQHLVLLKIAGTPAWGIILMLIPLRELHRVIIVAARRRAS